eukprot:XP_002532853.2 kelch repeat and BTB domain-containing protein 13 [Ricinus communis]
MWHLSRKPNTPSRTTTLPNNNNLQPFSPRNSIFPISDTGVFKNICIIRLVNKDDDDQHVHCNNNSCNLWDFFAYLSSPTQFHSVAIPRCPSFRIEVIAILSDNFLCTKFTLGPNPFSSLCTYTCSDNELSDVPKMHCEDRNLVAAAAAFLDGFLYLAGGYKGNPPDVEPSVYLNMSERLNLKTWEWQTLPDMQNQRAFATGAAHRNKFYVVGGSTIATLKHSAEIYDPKTNSWKFVNSFVPKEADGYAVASFNGQLLILTWSDRLGMKLWLWIEMASPNSFGNRPRLISCFPCKQIEMMTLRQNGANMVRVGRELWIVVGKNDRIFQVDGRCAWPVFPAPFFRPSDEHKVQHKEEIYALSFSRGLRVTWRKIPVYYI